MTTGLYNVANSWLNQTPAGYFPGSQVAGFTPNQTGSWDEGMNAAQRVSDLGAAGIDQWVQSMDYGRGGNPYLDETVKNMQDQSWQGFRRGTLPSITNNAIGSGQMGSSRHALAQGVATGDMGRAITDATANMYSQGYGQNLNFQQGMMAQAPALMNQYNNSTMAPFAMQQDIGAQQQGMNQSRLNDAVGRWNYNRDLQQNMITGYGNMLGQVQGGTQTGQLPQYQDPYGAAVGGAMTGYSLGNAWRNPQPNVNQYAPNVNAYNSGGGFGSEPWRGL